MRHNGVSVALATVGCQQGGNVANKVVPMLANNQHFVGNGRSVIYPTAPFINAPPQSTLSKKLFDKNNI